MIGMAYTWEELKKLSVAERSRLLETIWESLEDDTASLEISDELKRKLEARWAEHLRDPSSTLAWDELRKRYGRAQ
jgi:putative addiction module component (TIGR02574 family)